MQDYSYALVNQCELIKQVEQGISFDPNILLCHDLANKTIDGRSQLEKSLAAFEASLKKRNPKVEHSILNRLNCHKEKFDELYKSHN